MGEINELRNEPLPIVCVHNIVKRLIEVSGNLKKAGFSPIVTLDDNRKVRPFLKENLVAMVLLDIEMPFLEGRFLLGQIKQEHPEVPVIVVGENNVEKAIEFMRLGANDYLVRPLEMDRLLVSLRRTLENVLLGVRFFPKMSSLKLRTPAAFTHIITASRKMLDLFKYIEVIADSPYPVLVTGETGVGKELVARSIHLACDPDRPFIAVNVAGLDDNMFSDTLFGHKKGAFTGADSQREGLIAKAEKGTLFLDEIGDLNQNSQVKLLRLIQEKEYYPLGDDHPKKSNARIICSTNHDLKKLVENGAIRKDLFYRLNTHAIVVPPLRERRDDIPALLEYFVEESAQAMNKGKPKIPAELLPLLCAYDFPGNVRELQTLVADAVSRYHSGALSLESFRKVISSGRGSALSGGVNAAGLSIENYLATIPTLKQAEGLLISKAIERADGNQGIAASLLGITRQALNNRLVRGKKKK
jgi:DNA-binding NtrC family response regulator